MERGDLPAVHEPFSYLTCFGGTTVDGRTWESSLLAWLRDRTGHPNVFLKDTTDYRHPDVLAYERFLAEGPWRRAARWHVDVAASSGFERRTRTYPHTLDTDAELARFAAHHRPF